jgi:hypothetical protein
VSRCQYVPVCFYDVIPLHGTLAFLYERSLLGNIFQALKLVSLIVCCCNAFAAE